jgi:hypothetical protein
MSDERSGVSIPLDADGELVLFGERLRDGRIALGTKRRRDGEWLPGELHLLERGAYLALAGWLAPAVEESWLETVRERQAEPLDTARELYGDAADGADRLAGQMLRQLPPSLLRRALLLLVNSIGPDARERLVEQLNRTTDFSQDAQLRRQLAEEEEALAYAVAAAALLDAIAEGLVGPGADGSDGAE